MTNKNKTLEERLLEKIQKNLDKENNSEHYRSIEASNFDERNGVIVVLISHYSGEGPSTRIDGKSVLAYKNNFSGNSNIYENKGNPEYYIPKLERGLFDGGTPLIGYNNGKICAFRGLKILSVKDKEVNYELFPTENSAKDYNISPSFRIIGKLNLNNRCEKIK